LVPRLVKLGLVGIGDIAIKSYLPTIAGLRGSKIDFVAACDVVEERAKKAKEFGARKCYTDYYEMLKKEDIELIVNTTPFKLHAPFTIAAAKAGKHVLVQKPLATTLEDGKAMIEAARKARVKLGAEPSNHLDPWCQEAKRLIAEGAIGKACFARCRSAHFGSESRPTYVSREWKYRRDLAGVVNIALFDLGGYAINQLTELLGHAKRVAAFSGLALPERFIRKEQAELEYMEPYGPMRAKSDVDDNAMLILDFGEGVLAGVETNYCFRTCVHSLTPGLEVHGTEGSIYLETPQGPLVVYSDREEYAGLKGWFTGGAPSKGFSPPQGGWGEYKSVEHMADCILEDKEPLLRGEHALHVLEIMVKAIESAETGRAMNLSTAF